MPSASDETAFSERPQFSLRKLLATFTVIALCIGVASASARYAKRRDAIRRAELAQLDKLDDATIKSIVMEVEAIRAKLGRAPKDEAELEIHLGRPMPVVHDGIHPTLINYWSTGEDSFMLQYELWATDDWIYDSTIPNAGWVQHWY
jgi:hypothetical protein